MIQKNPTTPHDAAFKGFLTQIDNARDFSIFICLNIFARYVTLIR